jgi:peptidyl-prolyl isomerase E (cyclophilin E)
MRLYYLAAIQESKHRGFAFVTYSSTEDAQDAIDNMDMNELQGRVLKVNLARNLKVPTQGAGNRASTSSPALLPLL